MSNIFNTDNKVMSALTKVADMMILSILYVIACIPVITIGAATTALYYSTVKALRRNRGYVFRSFWTAFKDNFFKSTIIWILVVAVGALLSFNMHYAGTMGNSFGKILFFFYIIITCIGAMTCVYLFPEQSRFVLSVKQVIKNSFLMSIRHLPYTLLMVAILTASIVMAYVLPQTLILLPAGSAWLISMPMEHILKNYVPEDANIADEWYME